MNIGLDWDGTCTEDTELYFMFVNLARSRGHKVWIVTMRYPSEVNNPKNPEKSIPQYFIDAVDGIVFTSREAKRPAVEKVGIEIDVWIDDNPIAVEKSATEIWGWHTPEGVVVSSFTEAEQAMAELSKAGN